MIIEVPAVTTGIGQGPEIGWIIKDASGAVVDTGGVIPLTQLAGTLNPTVGTPYPAYMDTSYNHMVCLEWGCYTIELYDAWGDGWGGCTYSLVDDITGFVYASGSLVHVGLAPYQTFTAVDSVCMDPCSPFSLSVSSVNDALCAGGSDGEIEINPLPGATYSWSNGATGTYIYGLSAGTYTVIATDGTCSDTLSVIVGEPTPITATMLIGNESAPGAMDGQIDLTVSGGSPCETSDSLFVWNSLFTIILALLEDGLSKLNLHLPLLV